jgi:hypothetical protein
MNYGLLGLLGIPTGIDAIRNIARAVEHAAATLEPDVPQLAGFVREAAQTVDRLSTDLRERSLGEIASSVSSFARREPVAFLGGAVLAGFLLGRLAQRPAHDIGASRVGTSGVGASGRDVARMRLH